MVEENINKKAKEKEEVKEKETSKEVEKEEVKEKETDKETKNTEKSKPAVAKTSKKKSDKKEEVVELEREYVVPLRRGSLNVPRYKRAKKAVKILKEFLAKHMKVEDRDLKRVKIDIYLNNEIWFRGIKKPANKIKVKAIKKGGIVYAELSEVPDVARFAKANLEKRNLSVVSDSTKKQDHEKKGDEDGKDKDGVADAVKEDEDKKAGAEKEEKTEKTKAKAEKHTAKAKTGKQEKQAIHRKAMKR